MNSKISVIPHYITTDGWRWETRQEAEHRQEKLDKNPGLMAWKIFGHVMSRKRSRRRIMGFSESGTRDEHGKNSSMMIRMMIWEGDDEVCEAKIFNYAKHKGRVKVTNALTWALNRNYVVEMERITG